MCLKKFTLKNDQNNLFIVKSILKTAMRLLKLVQTERGGSVVTRETRIREVPGSNPVAGQRV